MLLAQGYHALTMTEIADACGLTRRALYHHFHSKEELFRAMLVQGNLEARDRADWTARKTLASGGDALKVISEWIDSRFGVTRRTIGQSHAGEELNHVAFGIANDIMIEVSQETNERLVRLLQELSERGKLTLKPGHSIEELAQILGDGARGVNQQRPSVPPKEIAPRYRRITQAILQGCVELSAR